ncbi:hypothetical protein, partial [Nocardia cyriacigeorgica]|uniref:hypothetical protein n=1 Tax=Nocardia cyriacigeorgica TaxID=135487 RepID=UPI002457020B
VALPGWPAPPRVPAASGPPGPAAARPPPPPPPPPPRVVRGQLICWMRSRLPAGSRTAQSRMP